MDVRNWIFLSIKWILFDMFYILKQAFVEFTYF